MIIFTKFHLQQNEKFYYTIFICHNKELMLFCLNNKFLWSHVDKKKSLISCLFTSNTKTLHSSNNSILPFSKKKQVTRRTQNLATGHPYPRARTASRVPSAVQSPSTATSMNRPRTSTQTSTSLSHSVVRMASPRRRSSATECVTRTRAPTPRSSRTPTSWPRSMASSAAGPRPARLSWPTPRSSDSCPEVHWPLTRVRRRDCLWIRR